MSVEIDEAAGPEGSAPQAQVSGEQAKATEGPPSVHVLSFTMLMLLVEAAAAHLAPPMSADPGSGRVKDELKFGEAKLAIDAANALLAAVGKTLSREERLAIEGMLTQLQVDYVMKTG
jgi:Domain of unknown function (DUF1844)